MGTVAEQHISPKCSKCKSVKVKTDLLNVDKIDITKAVSGWSVFAIGVDLGKSRVLSGQPDSR